MLCFCGLYYKFSQCRACKVRMIIYRLYNVQPDTLLLFDTQRLTQTLQNDYFKAPPGIALPAIPIPDAEHQHKAQKSHSTNDAGGWHGHAKQCIYRLYTYSKLSFLIPYPEADPEPSKWLFKVPPGKFYLLSQSQYCSRWRTPTQGSVTNVVFIDIVYLLHII